ncbi:MAG: pyridoxamine 5'-phosphate oxidase family protein [Candidatus Omnitrophica bacterium]|nr:pyridoxamine 5'-phosphate oxidase family protein [Candidatus Omnitrophota bacterium]
MNKKIHSLLKSREFVSVATCDFDGLPNAAPKFLLKIEDNFVFLVDYTIGKTARNLRVNPKISISFMDTDSLIGYQLNGSVKVIDSGGEYELFVRDLLQKEIDLSARRIVEGVTKEKSHKSFELSIPDTFVIFKVKIEEVVEMSSSGILRRENIC